MSEWNGEGIPPVGTLCEATWGSKNAWIQCIILWDGVVAVRHTGRTYYTENMNDYDGDEKFEFRPIQSEEQRQVAEIDAIIANYTSASGLELAQEIYNAGFRKEMSDGR